MANKRMFSRDITDTSRFLMLPSSASTLYFHMVLHADDEGYCEYVPIVRLLAASMDDIRTLQESGLICVYDMYTLCIRDWHTHNKVPKDRYKDSAYLKRFPNWDLDIKEQYNPIDNSCKQDVNKKSTQIRLDKSRLDKNKDKDIVLCKEVIDYLNEVAGKNYKYTDKHISHVRARFNEGFSLDHFKTVIDVMYSHWKDDEQMRAYLRPSTLFGTKFDEYLNRLPKQGSKKEAQEREEIIREAKRNAGLT